MIKGESKRLMNSVKSTLPRYIDSVSIAHKLVMYVYEWKHALYKFMSIF